MDIWLLILFSLVVTLLLQLFLPSRRRRYSVEIRLPEDADADAITATAKNGVVTIAIGKSANAQERAIEVRAA